MTPVNILVGVLIVHVVLMVTIVMADVDKVQSSHQQRQHSKSEPELGRQVKMLQEEEKAKF